MEKKIVYKTIRITEAVHDKLIKQVKASKAKLSRNVTASECIGEMIKVYKKLK
jgi:hypothetical protein